MEYDWKRVKTEYITDINSSYRKLSEKYGIPLGTLSKMAKREKWGLGKKKFRDKTVDKQISLMEKKQVDKMRRIQDITDKLLEKLSKAVDELDLQLCKKAVKVKEIEYKNIDRPDKPTKEVIHEDEEVIEIRTIIDRKGVQELSSAIKNLKEVQMLKTELDEEEQKARIDKLRKDADDGNAGEDKPSGIILMPPIMENLTPPKGDDDG